MQVVMIKRDWGDNCVVECALASVFVYCPKNRGVSLENLSFYA